MLQASMCKNRSSAVVAAGVKWKRRPLQASILAALTGMGLVGVVSAAPISYFETYQNVNWTSAGVGGIGDTGTGTIMINGVNGTVTNAYLYWHGMDADPNAPDFSARQYDNPGARINGVPIIGTSLGTAGTNCWGEGLSQAYRAEVTGIVTGDGDYLIEGLTDGGAGYDVNGASLIVIFDDGDPATDRDLVIFDGNDSTHAEGIPGETDGWNAVLSDINYGGGDVFAEFHVADGQTFPNDDLTISSQNGSMTISDQPGLWDGSSVPDEGNSRALNGSLWDIHEFDIAAAFGGVSGNVDLEIDGMRDSDDCLALVSLVLDLEDGAVSGPTPQPSQPLQPDPSASPVPIPATSAWGLLATGLLMPLVAYVGLRRRRKGN